MEIRDLLHRRNDLGTFLVHLCRDSHGSSARDNLLAIIHAKAVEARSVYGHLRSRVQQLTPQAAESQKVVCFTETPLEFAYLLTQEITGRQIQFQPYGIAFTKKLGRMRGINPVWYVDMTVGHHWITNNLDVLADRYVANGCIDNDLAAIFPYVEHMGSGQLADGGGALPAGQFRKEFWWEREWRKRGTYPLNHHYICLCPEAEFAAFNAALTAVQDPIFDDGVPVCIDPRWGLERIIAKLAGFRPSETNIL
jgi:hypothetical protein